MRTTQQFKNPDDGSEADELDELIEDEPERDVPVIVAVHVIDEDDVDDDPDIANLYEDEDISEDSFDPNATDSDDDDEDGIAEMLPGTSDSRQTRSSKAKEDNAASTENDDDDDDDNDIAAGGGVFDMNADDETDETIRSMIAAIKKPRSSPPEIILEDFITDICFHPEKDLIALATIIGDVHIYNYSNTENKLVCVIEVHAKSCRDVEFSNDGRLILTCSKDKSILITDLETERLTKFYETAHDDAINKLHIIDNNLFATGDDGGTVKLWDLRNKDPIFELKEVEDQITQLLTNDSNKLLLATSADGYLTSYNICARKLFVQSEPYEEELNCMGIYRGDSKLVVGTSKGRLYSYNWGQFGYHSDMYPGIKSSISEMIPITDRIACVAGEEGIIRACHIAPFRNLGIVGQHNMPIEKLDVNHDGELIASSSHNNDVLFWNVKYFEDIADNVLYQKHNTYKEKRHNLPSSKCTNTTDFFADLANPPTSNDDEMN